MDIQKNAERTFSLGHLTVLGCDPPALVYLAAAAGYDFISPRIMMMNTPNEQGHDYTLAKKPLMLQETRRALAATGLGVHDVELARIYDGLDVSSYLPSFEVAAELGARQVICSAWTNDRAFVVDQFATLCVLGRPLGLTINLEPMTWSGVRDVRDALDVITEAGSSNAGILIDTLHFHRSSSTLDDLDAIPSAWVHFVHIADAPGETPADDAALTKASRAGRLYLGEGGIDVNTILAHLPEVPCVIELPNADRSSELGDAEHARRCLASAKEYLARGKA